MKLKNYILLFLVLTSTAIIASDTIDPMSLLDQLSNALIEPDFESRPQLEPWPLYEELKHKACTTPTIDIAIRGMSCAFLNKHIDVAFRLYIRAKCLAALDIACLQDRAVASELLETFSNRLLTFSELLTERTNNVPTQSTYLNPRGAQWQWIVHEEFAHAHRLIDTRSTRPAWITTHLGYEPAFCDTETCKTERAKALEDSLQMNLNL